MEKTLILKTDYVVEKRNVLNEMRAVGWTLQELRFFALYLSKINARDESSRFVRFPLNEFSEIMGMERIQEKDVKPVIKRLLQKIVEVPLEKGRRGFKAFQLFSHCEVEQDKDGEWSIEFNAHDKALPLMFDFKNMYLSYAVGNVLRLKGGNQFRMYEILKQYEKAGEITISLSDLRDMLGLKKDEYPRFDNFKARILNDCQKALAEKTDIKYTYDPIRKKGLTIAIKFFIEKNTCHVDQLMLDELINFQQEQQEIEPMTDEEKEEQYDEHLRFIAGACDYEFSNTEMQVIFNIIRPIRGNLNRYNTIKDQYDKMKMYAERKEGIHSTRFGYVKKVLTDEVKNTSDKGDG